MSKASEEKKELEEELKAARTWTILSTRTMQYMIRKDGIRIYMTKAMAEKDAEALEEDGFDEEDYMIDGPSYRSLTSITKFCLEYGIGNLTFVKDEERKTFRIVKPRGDHGYYNPSLARTCILTKQNKKKKYLLSFANADYILPIEVDRSENFPKLKFCFARSKKTENLILICFTDLSSFASWQSLADKENKYAPIKLNFEQTRRLADSKGFLINPGSLGFVVTEKIMDMILDAKIQNEQKKKEQTKEKKEQETQSKKEEG